jgi:tetraacyldisaccharide-1-P 4'-kinase
MLKSSPLLAPLTWWYRIYLWWRNLAYDMKFLPSYRANIPVISLGGLLPGTAGKSIFIESLIRYYQNLGIKICVIFRNDRNTSANTQVVSDGRNIFGTPFTVNDDAFQIAKKISCSYRYHGR